MNRESTRAYLPMLEAMNQGRYNNGGLVTPNGAASLPSPTRSGGGNTVNMNSTYNFSGNVGDEDQRQAFIEQNEERMESGTLRGAAAT